MTTTPTRNQQGENVRGFIVMIDAPGHPRMTYPCTGHPFLTGQEAIRIMQGYKDNRHGVKTTAYTCANGIEDTLTLDELKPLYEGITP